MKFKNEWKYAATVLIWVLWRKEKESVARAGSRTTIPQWAVP
jgi:hypothetical protein